MGLLFFFIILGICIALVSSYKDDQELETDENDPLIKYFKDY